MRRFGLILLIGLTLLIASGCGVWDNFTDLFPGDEEENVG